MAADGERRRGVLVVSSAVVLAGVCAGCSERRIADATLWFDAVTFRSPSTVVGTITSTDLTAIQAAALREAQAAFTGLRVAVDGRPSGRYHVRVVQQLRDLRHQRVYGGHAGESRAVAGLGGAGAVSFDYFAALAIGYAPPGTDRPALIEAIGRCLGRGAVHEFAHQLLPTTAIHELSDRRTYEYYAGGRAEHCYGPIGWGKARSWLEARFGTGSARFR
jgi:hypothetical protein